MSGSNLSYQIQPGGSLSGSVRVPGDKSISHRAVMLASLAHGASEVRGFLTGEDCLCTMKAFRAMGVRIDQLGETHLRVHGVGLHGLREPAQALDLGNSGTSMRLMSGLLAAQAFPTTLIGDESLSRRPMRRIVDPLRQMGARIETTARNTAPLRIEPAGGLQAITYRSPVASAQVKSGILLAGLYADGRTEVFEPEASRDHTERMLRAFGVEVEAEHGRAALRGGQALRAADIDVPADISSATFFLVGAAIVPGSELLLTDVGINPTRTGVIEILRRMGADIELLNPRQFGGEPVADLRVRGRGLRGIAIGHELVAAAIDEFPAVFIAAACAEGETLVTGAEELRVKESDRIQAMCDGLNALGLAAEGRPDGARIPGGKLGGGSVDSKGDHRIAMSFAVAGLRAAQPIRILDCLNVNTSFPGFVGLAQGAGLRIEAQGEGERRVTIPVVTVDGPSGVGKGMVTRWLAQHLGWHRLDSGALYRILALAASRAGIDLDQAEAVASLAPGLDIRFVGATEAEEAILVGGEDWTTQIRAETTGGLASRIAAAPPVRAALLQRQRDFRQAPGLVGDGRDMGTVVFPDAGLKLFLDASPEARAERRLRQLSQIGVNARLIDLCAEIRARDERDRNRTVAPLAPAADAVTLDSTQMAPAEVLAEVEKLLRQRGIH